MSITRALRLTIATALAATAVVFAPATSSVQAAGPLSISKAASDAVVESGQLFEYTVLVSCSTTTGDCDNAVVTDVLPPELSGAAADVFLPPLVGATASYDEGTRTVTWTFTSDLGGGRTGLPTGSTVELLVGARFPAGTTPDGTVATNTASVSADIDGTPTTVDSNPVDVTSTATFAFDLVKSVGAANIGLPVTYDIELCSDPTGGLDMEAGATLVDTLPAGAEFLGATNGGAETAPGSGIVEWTLPAVAADGQCHVVGSVTVLFPDDVFVEGEIVTNTASVTDPVPLGATDPEPAINTSIDTPLVLPTGEGGTSKSGPEWITPGQPFDYTLTLDSVAFLPITDAVLVDTIPDQVDVTSITVPAGVDRAFYTSDTGPPGLQPLPFTPGDPVLKTDLIGAGDFIASLRFEADSLDAFTTLTVTVGAEVIDGGLDRSNAAIVEGSGQGDGTTVENCTTFTYVDHESTAQSDGDCHYTDVKQEFAVPRITKTADPGPYLPGATVSWDITVTNTEAASTDLDEFVIRDLLPDEYDDAQPVTLTYVPGSAALVSKPAGAPDPVIDDSGTFAGRTQLEWRWTTADLNAYSLAPGEEITVTFQATFGDPVPPGTVTNHASLSNWLNESGNADPDKQLVWECDAPAVADADLVALNATDTESRVPCYASAPVGVQAITGLGSVKWVRGEKDVDIVVGSGGDLDDPDPVAAGFSRFPSSGFTYQGGYVDYRLILNNPGNVPIDDLVLVDIFPFVGDTGVLTGARGSEWRPILVEPITLPPGLVADVYYSIEESPCLDSRLKVPASCTDWSTTPPVALNEVRAVMIDIDDAFVIPAGGSLQIPLSLTAPAGTPIDGAIAWNSFAFSSRRADTGTELLPAEPRKVGIEVGNFESALYGDYVWFDFDHDGIQDAEETGPALVDQPDRPTGINGVRVQFYEDNDGTPGPSAGDEFVRVTYTQDDFAGDPGYYSFPELDPGTYYAVFDVPTGYELTLVDAGADDVDSDADFDRFIFEGATITDTGATVDTQVVVPSAGLAPGAADLSWDVGFWDPNNLRSSLGDRVFYDNDTSGVQESTEDGVENVTVNLWWVGEDGVPDDGAGDDIRVQTTTTDSAGDYRFDWLVPGPNYYVEFVEPSGLRLTTLDTGGDDTIDSDADPATGFTELIDLDNGPDPAAVVWDPDTQTVEPQWDAGLYVPNSIGDFVWDDLNRNGIQETGDVGIVGVTVTLYSPGLDGAIGGGDDVEVAATTTVANGFYEFTGLPNGDYFVVVTPPADHFLSPADVPGDDAVDSDGEAGADEYADLVVMTSITTLQIEPGVDLTLNTADDVADDEPTWDFGLYQLASIGDYVWEDLDRDGIQETGEPGINGVTVTLLDEFGVPVVGVAPTVTANNPVGGAPGWYAFSGLEPDTYSVRFDLSTAPTTVDRPWFFSPQDQGVDTTDSDVAPLTGTTAPTELVSGENDPTWDAGIWRWASIGDYVWHDLNGDGLQTTGEPGINGVTVTLLDAAGDPVPGATTVTADDPVGGAPGWYEFDDLDPDTYSLQFDLASAVLTTGGFVATGLDDGTNDLVDSDAHRTTGITASTQLTSNEDDPSWDAGFYVPVSLGDYVWYDSDVDGLLDPTDEDPATGIVGVNGVTVRLLSSTGTVLETTTTANNPVGGAPGWYEFDDLRPGTYGVEFVRPDGFSFSPANVDTDDTIDSDAVVATATTARTGPIVLVSDNDDFTWDAGIYQFAGLGDFVWDDLDADGVQDPGEPGINGVTVILLDIDGDPIPGATTVTADDPVTGDPGWYEFTELVPGVYSVQFDLTSPALDGYEVSPRDATDPASPGLDSDASTTDGSTIPTVLDLNEFDPTWDAGFYLPASLGDFVWDDLDGDGIQDPGEPGINGVNVILLDAAGDPIPGATTTTANHPVSGDPGYYEFTDLVPGTYAVQFDLTSPALTTPGYVQSPLGTGTANDSDAGPAGVTASTTLVSGENDPTWDAGFYIPVAVGDFVWEDLDGDGFQEAGEPGINGVTVLLLDAAGDPIPGATTVTANHPISGDPGFYEFTGLAPGIYAVRFDLSTAPSGFIATIRDADLDVSDATDSDADATTGITAPTAFLESGDEDRTLDLGLVLPVGVGDYVWQDLDGDGIQDSGEPPISGVDVDLYLVDPDGGPPTYIDTRTTAASGLYQFTGLAPGSYFVEFDLDSLPTGMVATLRDEGTDDAADSDADPVTGRTAPTAFLESQDSDITLDLGAYYPVTVGDFVWNDLDGDGIQDSGEPGVPGVVAYLLDADGNRVTDGLGADLTATTIGSGFYEFTGLAPGAYAVEFDPATLPTGFVVTFADQGSDDGLDSDADASGITTLGSPIPSGGSDPTHDLGIYAPVSVGDRVWEDVNGDGIQDPGEPGVDGIGVTLYLVDPDGGAPTIAGTTSTSGGGNYLFTDLPPGSYYVEFDLTTLPTDMVATLRDQGTDDGLDSDADRTTGTTAPTPFLPSGADPDLSLDLGIYAPVSVGDRVWDDLDGDGIQDPGEPGVEGVGVTLYLVDPDGGAPTPAGTTTTGTDGSYLFSDLPPAEYFVVFDLTTLPGAYVPTFDNVGDEATDSDADPASGETRTTGFLASQSDDLDLDLGLFIPVSVGDFVWFDESGDGVQDSGEPGVPDVDVTLWSVGPDGLADTADDIDLGSDTTDADGRYLFSDLPPGDYYVVFDLDTLPPGRLPTLTDRGGDDGLDSDADRVSGMTAPTGLIPSGSADLSLDLGIVVPVTIGDLVWEDTDADGIQDAGEPGIAGVTVNLFLVGPDGLAGTADDVFVESATTNGTGEYLFTDQVPGEYFVEFDLTTLPSGYVPTVVDAGSDDTVDSDGDSVTGRTRTTGFLDGTGIDTNDLDLDLGVYVPATLGDFVWQDRNGDGTQQDDEPGVPGVTVRLVDPGPDGVAGTADDVEVDTTTTDADGEYLFTDVVPGTYFVEIDLDTLPDGAILSPTTPDCDCGEDSDVDPDTARTGIIDVPFGGDDRTWDAGIILPFDLQLTKVSEGEFRVNAPGTFVLTVVNDGPGDALGPLQLIDELPAGLTFDSAAGSGWSCSADGQTVTCLHADDLPVGARTELRLVVIVTPSAASGFVNSATVESLSHPQLDLVGSNDGASTPAVTIVTPIGELPRTGGGVLGPVTWAAIILAVGIALAVSSRRRRSQLRVLR